MRPPRREERRTDEKKDYVTWSLRVGNHVQNSKYVLREMIKAPKWFAGGVKGAGLELNTAFEAIRISSSTSFVHETESQVILNGSRDINFTMDLVAKDIGLFQAIADRAQVPLEISPRLIEIFDDGIARFGARAFSPRIVERLEAATGLDVRAPGFPAEIVDDEPEAPGAEVWAPGHGDR